MHANLLVGHFSKSLANKRDIVAAFWKLHESIPAESDHGRVPFVLYHTYVGLFVHVALR